MVCGYEDNNNDNNNNDSDPVVRRRRKNSRGGHEVEGRKVVMFFLWKMLFVSHLGFTMDTSYISLQTNKYRNNENVYSRVDLRSYNPHLSAKGSLR